jgi:Cu(I)-responsive transcriptional regulator
VRDAHLAIGELGRLTDTKVETIRYYERIGLLAAPARTAGNYRAYGPEHLSRLSFVRRSRDLGFSLDQVRALLDLSDDRERSCEAVDAIAKAHLTEVDRRIPDLRALRRELASMVEQCRRGTVAECRIIYALSPKGPP